MVKEFHYGAYKVERETIDENGHKQIEVRWERPQPDENTMIRSLFGLPTASNFEDDWVVIKEEQ